MRYNKVLQIGHGIDYELFIKILFSIKSKCGGNIEHHRHFLTVNSYFCMMIIVFMNKAFFLFINLSGSELFVILTVAFLVFGPKKLPEMGRKAGHFLKDLKKTTQDITREFENEAQPVKSEFNKLRHEIRSVNEKASLKKEASDNKKEKK